MFSLKESVNEVDGIYRFYRTHRTAKMSNVSEVDIFKMIRYGRMYVCDIYRKDGSSEIIGAAGVKDYLVPTFLNGQVDVRFVLEAGAMLSGPTGFALQRKLHAVRFFDSIVNEDPDLYLSATFGTNKESASNMVSDEVFEEWVPPFSGLSELRRAERVRNHASDTEVRWFRPTRTGVRVLAEELRALSIGYVEDRSAIRSTDKARRFKPRYEFDLPRYDQVEFALAKGPLEAAAAMAKRFLDENVRDEEVDDFFETSIFKA